MRHWKGGGRASRCGRGLMQRVLFRWSSCTPALELLTSSRSSSATPLETRPPFPLHAGGGVSDCIPSPALYSWPPMQTHTACSGINTSWMLQTGQEAPSTRITREELTRPMLHPAGGGAPACALSSAKTAPDDAHGAELTWGGGSSSLRPRGAGRASGCFWWGHRRAGVSV